MPPDTTSMRIALVGLVSLALAVGIGRFAFTPLLPMMQADGLVGIAGGGLLASVHFLGYWLGAAVAARLPWAPRTGLRLSLILIALTTLGMGLTESFPAWLALRFIAGLASAFILVLVSTFIVKRLAETGRAGQQGWVFSGVGAGIAVAGLGVLALMAGGIGSAASWIVFGIAALAVALAVCYRLGAEVPNGRPEARHAAAARTPLDWRLLLAYGAAGLGYIIPATYLPIMARASVPSPLVFGWSWPVFGLAAFLSTLLAARLHARFSNRRVWAVSQGVMALGLILPAVQPHLASIMAAGVAVGGTFMVVTMAGLQEVHRTVPPEDALRHVAAMTAAFATGQIIGPLFAGLLYDLTLSFTPALIATSLLLMATAASLLAETPKTVPARGGKPS